MAVLSPINSNTTTLYLYVRASQWTSSDSHGRKISIFTAITSIRHIIFYYYSFFHTYIDSRITVRKEIKFKGVNLFHWIKNTHQRFIHSSYKYTVHLMVTQKSSKIHLVGGGVDLDGGRVAVGGL